MSLQRENNQNKKKKKQEPPKEIDDAEREKLLGNELY